MTIGLHGRNGLVTGAAGGIGRATAVALAKCGANVVIADLGIREVDAAKTVALVEEHGGRAVFEPCDVTNPRDTERVVATVRSTFGGIDFAHNNAGVVAYGPLLHTDDAVLEQTFAVNVFGVWNGMKAQLAAMVEAGSGGAIVNTASVAGLSGIPGGAAYVTSKHAVVGMTRSAAADYASVGIRVNAVCPGLVETAMAEALPPEAQEGAVGAQMIKRLAHPSEIAAAVVWLLSDAASFVTGAAVPVDGGGTDSL